MSEWEAIEIVGAAVNNLKHIDVNIPKEKLVMLAGISGSGKSSLAFDSAAKRSSRWHQYHSTFSPLFLSVFSGRAQC